MKYKSPCKKRIGDMILAHLYYNIIAYFVMLLPFICHSWSFMTIIREIFKKTSIVQPFKAPLAPRERALFLLTGPQEQRIAP
jgi:hypothetical protein